jgi:ribose transport system permease protein
MLRIAGVLLLLACLFAGLHLADPERGLSLGNLRDLLNRQGQIGIITIGVAILIITGGIDLSIGSVMALAAVSFIVLIKEARFHPYLALTSVLMGGVLIGLVQGLLTTRLKLQAFLVTLCGMFVFRGLARYVSDKLSDTKMGLVAVAERCPEYVGPINTLRQILIGKDADGRLLYPMQFLVMLAVALVVGILLHKTVAGRYAYAIGHNEQAARYAGIRTERYRVAAFVLCSMLASLAGVMLMLDAGSQMAQNAGSELELYAITGAVLGGCSLRGGEGMMIGIVLGGCVLPLLRNVVNFASIPEELIPIFIGLTLLVGTLADEFFRARANRRGKT